MDDQTKKVPDFNSIWFETTKSARQAQIEYGRWIVNTLWLMHSGAIAGLLSKWDSTKALPHKWAVAVFVFGIVTAFFTAACAWFNFTIADSLFRVWTYAGSDWPTADVSKQQQWMGLTMRAAIAATFCSVTSLVVGAVIIIQSN